MLATVDHLTSTLTSILASLLCCHTLFLTTFNLMHCTALAARPPALRVDGSSVGLAGIQEM